MISLFIVPTDEDLIKSGFFKGRGLQIESTPNNSPQDPVNEDEAEDDDESEDEENKPFNQMYQKFEFQNLGGPKL